MNVFTIGHSRHETEFFLDLLRQHGVSCVIDVRSTPYSQIAPQFNKPALAKLLRAHNLLYAHFAHEFGARYTDSALLDADGVVDFAKVRVTEAFRQGMQRLRSAIEQGYTVALMCSEANPFDCHRFAMISYQLVREGFTVRHILKDASLLDNPQLEEQLLKKYQRKLPQNTLFETGITPEIQLDVAYQLRNKDIGFSIKSAQEGAEELL
jgi:uncharacterized protein (DUF488 family)